MSLKKGSLALPFFIGANSLLVTYLNVHWLFVITMILLSPPAVAEDLQSKQTYANDKRYTMAGSLLKYRQTYPDITLGKVVEEHSLNIMLDQVYGRASGRDLHIDIYRPLNKANHQAILLIHGGGWSSGNKRHMQSLAQALALKGYLTATLEYRLSPEALYPAAIIDIYQAIAWLKAKAQSLNFDSNKLSILGGSSGGHLAALVGFSAIHNVYLPESNKLQVKAVIDMDGILEVASGEGLIAEDKNGMSDSALARWLGGNFANMTARWQEASVPQYINADSPPLLFISSGQRRFKAGFALAQVKLHSFGIKVELINLDNTAHPFWLFEPWLSQIIAPIDQFLQKID
jgi:acetyl esterase